MEINSAINALQAQGWTFENIGAGTYELGRVSFDRGHEALTLRVVHGEVLGRLVETSESERAQDLGKPVYFRNSNFWEFFVADETGFDLAVRGMGFLLTWALR